MKVCCQPEELSRTTTSQLKVVTIGNPNSGKTTLFNALSGARQKVGNFSGVTIEKAQSQFMVNEQAISLTDLPGVYSLDIANEHGALDEQIALDYLQSKPIDLILNVVDASCLERSLLLTLQLKELGLPVALVLNKMDIDKAANLRFDMDALSAQLQLPIVSLSAIKRSDVNQLKTQLLSLSQAARKTPSLVLDYGHELNAYFAKAQQARVGLRNAIAQLYSATPLNAELNESQGISLYLAKQQLGELDSDLAIAQGRFEFIYQLTQAAVTPKGVLGLEATERLDRWMLGSYTAIPLFLFSMYLMFMFAINGGAVFIDFFDIIAGTVFVDGSAQLLEALNAPAMLTLIVSQGIGVGIQTVATFIPVIACLFLFLALLESSGYLARAAFVVDRFMQKLGLPGKAFVPMLMGFGCTVPAVMATRVLEQQRERLLTSSMAPFMSCGARLPVYALFVAAFFPHNGQNIVFLLYLLGILAAVLTGLMLKKTLLPGSASQGILELPDYQLPRPRNVALLTWHKVRGFMLGAGKTIVLVVALLSVLNQISLPSEGENSPSVLARVSQWVTPVFAPMGVEQNNWQATVGIVTGIFAKEAVVGTLNSLYSLDNEGDDEWSYRARFSEAFASIVENAQALNFGDPMGLEVESPLNALQAAEQNDVALSTFHLLQQHFTQASAFAYMLFILFYMPCAAAMGALVKELGRPWALLIAAWTTLLAYASAVIYYQASQFMHQPLYAFAMISLMLALVVAFVALLKYRVRGELRDFANA